MPKRAMLLLVLIGVFSIAVSAEQIDLSNAKIVVLSPKRRIMANAADMLRDEIEKRTRIGLEIVSKMPAKDEMAIVIGTARDLANKSYRPVARFEVPQKVDGYCLWTDLGYRPRSDWRMSWCRHADAMSDLPLRMHYTNLDKTARYKVRIVYTGGRCYHGEPVHVCFFADGIDIHPLIAKPDPVRPIEFDIPADATQDGELTLTWYSEPGRGAAGRGVHLGEVWLLKE